MHRPRPITAAIGLGGLSVAALLGGCATGGTDTGTGGTSSETSPSGSSSETSPSGTPSETDPSGTPSDAASGAYTDGDYSATGDYQSPGGAESIDVELTLASDVVADVTVSGNASGGNAERYQSQFEEGIAAEVVGVNIDELSVDRVAGSSLTSDGFSAAVEQIKADALA